MIEFISVINSSLPSFETGATLTCINATTENLIGLLQLSWYCAKYFFDFLVHPFKGLILRNIILIKDVAL